MPSRRVADEVKVLSVRVPLDVYERLVGEADKRGVTVAVLARERLTYGSVTVGDGPGEPVVIPSPKVDRISKIITDIPGVTKGLARPVVQPNFKR